MAKIFNTLWRANDELVIEMELELKASIISEILDLQRVLLFSPIEIRKNVLAQKSPWSLTLICSLAFSFSQTDLSPKGINCQASSYGPRISGADPPNYISRSRYGSCV